MLCFDGWTILMIANVRVRQEARFAEESFCCLKSRYASWATWGGGRVGLPPPHGPFFGPSHRAKKKHHQQFFQPTAEKKFFFCIAFVSLSPYTFAGWILWQCIFYAKSQNYGKIKSQKIVKWQKIVTLMPQNWL